MEWTPIALIVTSVGLVVIAGWAVYVSSKRHPPTLEELLYRRRITAIAEMNDLTSRACRCARELIHLTEELDISLSALPPSREETEVRHFVEEMVESQAPRGERGEIEAKGQRVTVIAKRLDKTGGEIDRALSRTALFAPEEIMDPLLDCLDLLTDVRERKAGIDRLEDLLGKRADFLAEAHRALGSQEFSELVTSDLRALRRRRRPNVI